MARAGYSQLLNWGAPWQTTTGTSLTTATTATISPQATSAKDFSILAGQLYVGFVFKVTARGFLTTTAVSTTATIFLAAGATPTTLATPVGITTGTGTLTGLQWRWTSTSRVTAIASTGNTILTQGELWISGSVAANPVALGTQGMFLPAPNVSGETAAAVDTTANMAVMMRGTLAGANATVSCQHFLIEPAEG